MGRLSLLNTFDNIYPALERITRLITVVLCFTMEHLSSIFTKLQGLDPLILTGLATLVYWLGLSFKEAWKVRPKSGHIRYLLTDVLPLAKATSNCRLYLTPPFSHRHNWIFQECPHRFGDWRAKGESIIVALLLSNDHHSTKWPGRMFKVPTPTGWWVVVTDPKHIEEVRNAPDNKLSQRKSIEQVNQLFYFMNKIKDCISQSLQSQFTLGSRMSKKRFHIPIIKTRLTKSLPELVPGVYDEVLEACNQYIVANNGAYFVERPDFWEPTNVYRMVQCQGV